MAIQVSGSFKHGYASYESPKLELIPHLTYRGGIAMDVNIIMPVTVTDSEGSGSISYTQVSAIGMYPNRTDLQAPSSSVDPYTDLIYSLESYVITQLSGSNPSCTFQRD